MNDCKGKIYKCRVNNFINSKGHIVCKTEFVPVKKLSCSGCEKCEWLDNYDELWESVYNKTLVYPKTPKNNKLYQIALYGDGEDWEIFLEEVKK